ncbi:hypothetical protein [Ktedonobacter racemifer]|uniref:Uncharacterized protein n=1 Tax=Ktedonobacter racemifer DSM 44963 TaxID=485913 RepID=D6TYW7_KTERA|nr:hypothetical protein [Ktedonobacter racemifer]EFH85192.1 hypothetical protein Krac_6362 [Ktedonobacter racemifer DSM 44963]
MAFGVWLIVWATIGCLTILRHYTLRLQLAWSRNSPLHAQPFLDDAVARVLLKRQGGQYAFVHRPLLDYFEDTPPEVFSNVPTLQRTVNVTAKAPPEEA